MTALGVAGVLAVLAVVCLSLVAWRNRAQAHERQSLQATFNARAGREHYLATGQLPPELALDPQDAGQRCRLTRESNGTLLFEGRSGTVSRRLWCKGGDPSRVYEEP
jgi:hypothetical protein